MELILTKALDKNDYWKITEFCQLCISNNQYLDEASLWVEKAENIHNSILNKERLKTEKIEDKKQDTERKIEALGGGLKYILMTKGMILGITGYCKQAIDIYNGLIEFSGNEGNMLIQNTAYLAALYIKSGDAKKGEKMFNG